MLFRISINWLKELWAVFIDKSWQTIVRLSIFLNLTVPKAFFFQWRRSAMLDFLNAENMKGTTFHFLFHAFDW